MLILENSILISNKDLDNIDNSITLIFTEDRRSIMRDTINNNDIPLFQLNENNQFGTNQAFNSEMDYFLKYNGLNNLKI
jgi:hypothetical protein